MNKQEKPKLRRRTRVTFVCGPSRDYFYGDSRPPKACSYFDFMEWQVAQLRKRRRPTTRP